MTMTIRLILSFLWTATLLLTHVPVLAEDNDIVIFDNGDRVTGEFKSLQRGRVTIKSYGASTINLYWDKVSQVQIERSILVETISGARYSGSIGTSDNGAELVVQTATGPVTVRNNQIVKMFPIDSKGLKDLKINVSAGYNFAKANNVTQANVGADVTQRTTRYIAKIRYSGNISDSDDNSSSQRRILASSYSRLRPNRWLTSGTLSFDTNDELNINLRSSVGAGIGRILSESDHSFFSLQGGLLLTRENLGENPDDIDSVESFIDVQWNWYTFANPDLDWSTDLRIIPSLTESGRVRADLNASLSWKLVGDLRWQLDFYSTYDSKPQSDDAENSDYGVNTSLAYKF